MTRIKRVERLGALYRRLEHMRELELHRAASAVAEIVAWQDAERVEDRAEVRSARTALAAGDTKEWILAESGRELISLRMMRHRDVQVRRERDREAATQVYDQSRIQREQMERLAAGQRRALNESEGRRMQTASDDRFLSRRAWLRSRGSEGNAPKA